MKTTFLWNLFFQALALQESSNDPSAFNEQENAIGLYQIRPIYVREVNRILEREEFKHEDAWSPMRSKDMILIHTSHHCKQAHLRTDSVESFLRIARMYARNHNGGSRGHFKIETLDYGNRFNEKLKGLVNRHFEGNE